MDLVKILDLNKFQLREDKFSKGEEDECKKSISWEDLNKIHDPKKYIKKLNDIKSNPKYETFSQTYFHAGDTIQFQKYALLKSRLLEYPGKTVNIKEFTLFNNYNLHSTYDTFLYLFNKVKKGIYVSIKNNALDVFLPFSNIGYVNNWADNLERLNPGLMRQMKQDKRNVSNPYHWYANNCFFSTSKVKFTSDGKGKGQGKVKGKEYISEGDKTETTFKYFLKYFLEEMNKTGNKMNDIDFFFSPRDFPVFRKNGIEPYDKLLGNKKLDKRYIHDIYTPILSQCTNIDFHDIPIPTQDDMLRITNDIYPDDCKNNKSDVVNFEMNFSKKKPVCVFRGGATGCGTTVETNMRLKAAYLSVLWEGKGKDILDARLTSLAQLYKPKINIENHTFEKTLKDDDSTLRGGGGKGKGKGKDKKDHGRGNGTYIYKGLNITAGKSNFMNLVDQSKHKYILNIDGHVKAFRLGNELRMGSVVLLVDSPYKLWFQGLGFKDEEHYILIKNDLSDLEEKIEWCKLNDDKCEQIAKNSLDFYNKYLSKEGMYDYFYNLLKNLGKIRRRPVIEKVKDKKLNIVVAYRDPGDNSRKAQLDIFLEQMSLIFEDLIDYHIYIVEQEGDRDDYDKLPEEFIQKDTKQVKFNLGILKNIGFKLANDVNKDDDNSYYVLSDVDLLPSNELINDYLKFPKSPIHLGNMGTRYNTKEEPDPNFLGGVLSFKAEDFIKCNGYPNDFWGWGGEDNALLYRLQKADINIDKSIEPVIDLEEESSLTKKGDIIKEKTNKLWEQDMYMKKEIKKKNLEENKNTWQENGVNSLDGLYKIMGDPEQYGGAKNISHYKVYLKAGSQDLPEPDSSSLKSDKESSDKEPSVKEPSDKEPSDKEPSDKEPSVKEPPVKEPPVKEPSVKEPSVKEPSVKEPSVKEPSVKDLTKLSLEKLYEKYEECQVNINSEEDIKLNEKMKKKIKMIIDNSDLTKKQLDELYDREYLSHPDYNNPNFARDISEKAEFNINKISLNKDNKCDNKEFELANHQRLLKNFINNETPYKSLLLFHGVGVGKTCSGVTISESFRDMYVRKNKKIIIVRKAGLSQGWKDTIFDPEKGDNQCSGPDFLDIVNEENYFNKRDPNTIKREQNKLIKKYYEFYQYGTFSGKIKEILGNESDPEVIKFKINKYFSNRLLIVDEYHNLREDSENLTDSEKGNKENQSALKNLYKVIKYSNNLRIVFLTATPMYNTASEIFLLLNFMLLNDNRPLLNEKDYIDKKTGQITAGGKDIINQKCRGYISYLRGENPVDFPLRLYPTDKLTILPEAAPTHDLFSERIKEPLRFLITYKNDMRGHQKDIYKKYLDKEVADKDPDKEKKMGINKKLPQICNIVYPSLKDKDYGRDGFLEVFNKSGKRFKYKEGQKQILKEKYLGSVSIKFKNILKNIKSSSGIIFIYTDYIWSGALPLALVLEHIGFNKYGNKNLLDLDDKEDPVSYDMKKHLSDYSDRSLFKQANYIILSGDSSISGDEKTRDNELKILKSEDNKNGELIKVVIGSSVSGEGVDLKNIREIHVVDPWYHLNKLEQIIGRGIRFCSHNMLSKDERNVTVFLHTTIYNGKETIDHYNYRRGERKSIEIGEIEMILKENAIDCYLFKGGNIIKKKDVAPINIKTSKGKDLLVEVYDKPNTKVCSFQSKCDYICVNINKKEKDKLDELTDDTLNYDTFDMKYFNDITKKITNYINELFEKKNYYSLEDIVDHIQYYKNINKYIIYKSIKNIIDHKETVYDKNKNKGYIICRGDYYIYQPLFNNDESIPIYYRSTTVNNKNKFNIEDIDIDYPEEIEDSDEDTNDIDIIKKYLISKYEDLIRDGTKPALPGGVLGTFGFLRKGDILFKKIYCEYLLDRLAYDDRSKYIRYLLNKNIKDISIEEGELFRGKSMKEFEKIAYDYFSNNFIYKNDKKRELFKSGGNPAGYFIINENELVKKIKGMKQKDEIAQEMGKCVEYYRKVDDDFKIIDTVNSDKKFETGKYWVHTYWNNSKEPVLKIVEEPYLGGRGAREASSGATSKDQLIKYLKNNIKDEILTELNNKIGLLSKYGKKELCKLIEIVFRLKDKISSDMKYFINFDLLYHKLK